MKKALCVLLSAILLLGNMPHSISAAESTPQYPPLKDSPIQITDTYEEELNSLTEYAVKTSEEIFSQHSGNNTVYSPVNCYLALCMLCELTDEASRAQLMELLEVDDPEDPRELAKMLWETISQEGKMNQTLLGNSFWLNDQYTMNPDSLMILGEDHHASGYTVPMGSPETDQAIQSWINEQTHDLLKNEAGGIQTDPSTLLMLISTLYFKDHWAVPFSKASTSEEIFTDYDGQDVKTDFMHQYQRLSSYFMDEEKGYKMASLYFQSGNRMVFLLPEEGTSLDSLMMEEEVLHHLFDEQPEEYRKANINWSVPKFDVNSDLNLVDNFKNLGLTDIFDPSLADFSPLTEEEGVYVDMIQHAGRVKIDEEGCEAAAFTAIGMKATAFLTEEIEEIEMNLDHPFAFCVLNADDVPLFVGVVNHIDQ